MLFTSSIAFAQQDSITQSDIESVKRDTTRRSVQIGDFMFNQVLFKHRLDPPIIFLNLHENEQTSIEALKKYAPDTAISYTYLEHGGERRISFTIGEEKYNFDPNRMFTKKGRKHTLRDGGNHSKKANYQVEKFATDFLSTISEASAIVAVHNNTDSNYSILSYKPDGSESKNTDSLYINPEMDPDDFIYTTNLAFYQAMVKHKISVILQDNKKFVDDGSLSVYCARRVCYVNIETEHGHLDKQLELLQLIHRVLREQIVIK
ncbi:MAG: hypothetical protein HRT57_14595 [Crocinitomicaceae bacterium]|nr:hypothetical protein [Crocinitomicaceae bacterium]